VYIDDVTTTTSTRKEARTPQRTLEKLLAV